MQITLAEAVDLSRDQNVTVGELEAKFGFEIVKSGTANVEAKAATPNTKPELVAHAKALFEAGTKRTKTGSGRPKRTLGSKEGSYPYNVTVTIDPSFKA